MYNDYNKERNYKAASRGKISNFLASIRIQMKREGSGDKTIEAYSYWIKKFIVFNDEMHPSRLLQTTCKKFLNSSCRWENDENKTK